MIPRTHEAIETLLQAVCLYSDTLKQWLEIDAAADLPPVRKFPAELRRLYERRVDFCDDLRRKLEDRRIDLRLDELFEAEEKTGPKYRKAKAAQSGK